MIYKKETGITLIALVITIIVLLILAGVTISIALDNGGLISRARDAATTYAQAEKNDVNTMDKLYKYIEGSVNENYYDPDEWTMAWTYSKQNGWSSTITDHNTNFPGDILAKLYEVGEEYHLTIEKIGESGAMGFLANTGNGNNEYKLASIKESIKLAGYRPFSPQAWRTVNSTYDKLTKVVIKDGVTNVGEFAFRGYSKLKIVVLPESVDTIESYAFYGCSSLTDIDLSNVETIKNDALYGCTSLAD